MRPPRTRGAASTVNSERAQTLARCAQGSLVSSCAATFWRARTKLAEARAACFACCGIENGGGRWLWTIGVLVSLLLSFDTTSPERRNLGQTQLPPHLSNQGRPLEMEERFKISVPEQNVCTRVDRTF